MSAKLVAIGDSLTQGFLNGSISKTHLAYPAFIAECLGDTNFNAPDFSGAGGLPLNFEALLNYLEENVPPDSGYSEQAIQQFLGLVEDYWTRGEEIQPSPTGPLHRNLAVWGFQIPDCNQLSDALCRRYMDSMMAHSIQQKSERALYGTVRQTLNPSQSPQYQTLTQLGVAQKIAEQEGGIDNLIFWLGSNHCLDTMVQLGLEWSTEETLNQPLHLRTANLWRPEHFQQALRCVADKVDQLGAKNIFVGNVPHITIPPVSRGLTPGAAPGEGRDADGYFEYYTHFWVWDSEFDPAKYRHLTRSQVKEIDAVVDEYNQIIRSEAAARGWHLVDTSNMLDRLAFYRQPDQPQYTFPPELVAALQVNPKTQDRVTSDGTVLLDTRYFTIDPQAETSGDRYQGGLFGLDGAHPTTLGYGLIAHEFLQVMQQVWREQGENSTVKPLDWDKIVASDTLLTETPENLADLQNVLAVLYGFTLPSSSPEAVPSPPTEPSRRGGTIASVARRRPLIGHIGGRPLKAGALRRGKRGDEEKTGTGGGTP